MIKHMLMWNLKESAEGQGREANAAKMKEILEGLNGKIPGLLKLEIGMDLSRGATSREIALYSEFETKEALAGYIKHPAHVAAAAFVNKVATDRVIVDFEV